jgi:hypothetical protein
MGEEERKQKAKRFRNLESLFNAIFGLSFLALVASIVLTIWIWEIGIKCLLTSLFLSVLSCWFSEQSKHKAEEFENTSFQKLKEILENKIKELK